MSNTTAHQYETKPGQRSVDQSGVELPALYCVSSTIDDFPVGHGRWDGVRVSWLVGDRTEPIIPYSSAILGYEDTDEKFRGYDEQCLNEMFNAEEVEQLMVYLWKNHQTVVEVQKASIPIASSNENLINMPTGALPAGGSADFQMLSWEESYNLPFKVIGYFNLMFSKESGSEESVDDEGMIYF
jgi:hypothetical protein